MKDGNPIPNATATFYEVEPDGSTGAIIGQVRAGEDGRIPTIRPVYAGEKPSLFVTHKNPAGSA